MEVLLAIIVGLGVLILGLLNSISRNINAIKNKICGENDETQN